MSSISPETTLDEIPRSHLEKNHLIGPYMIGETIGEGSYAKVKDGIHTETLIRVAIKVFKIKKIQKMPNGQISIDSEISILRRIKHHNVVRFYESLYNESMTKICLIFELCATSVQSVMDSAGGEKLPKFQAHDYFKQTLSALFYLHSRMVVHLDIKPGNLLLKFDNTLKVGDFGAAQEVELLADGSYKSLKSGGSPAYQSPEVLTEDEVADPFKIDVWSLGVTLYSMVVGKHPFMGESIYVICNNIMSNRLDHSGEDDNFKEIIKIMLESDPSKRATPDEVQQSKWSERKPPALETAVPLPPHSPLNPYFDTTIVDRLEDMYITEDGGGVPFVKKAKRSKKMRTCNAQ